MMNILCIGDIVGRPGRDALHKVLPDLRKEFDLDGVIVNGENAAGGSGIQPKHADDIFKLGVDAITLGDHTWDKKEIYPYLASETKIIRPANLPEGNPGRGWMVVTLHNGVKLGVINVLGRTFMRYNVDCPFKTLDRIVKEIRRETKNIIVDMHAETTSEKVAIGHYMDGRVSCLFGTHTHIQTADEKILPQGTAYITDLGMSGPYDSVIGQNKEKIIERFLTGMPQKFEVADSTATVHGIVVAIDEKTGQATKITRISRLG